MSRDEDLKRHIESGFSSPAAGELVATFRGWESGSADRAEWLRRAWPELHEALLAFSAHEMFGGLPSAGFDEFIGWVRDTP